MHVWPVLRAIVTLGIIAILSACSDRSSAPPARLSGTLAGGVESAVQSHRLTCHALQFPVDSVTLQPATGCSFESGDTLFYFWAEHDGAILAWGRAWHVPDSARMSTLRALAAANDARYGRGEVCPPTGRVEGFTVWRASDHFTYMYTDPEAASLSLAQNVAQASRLGTPGCTFRDWVSPPFLR
jgi:hypothetical protein